MPHELQSEIKLFSLEGFAQRYFNHRRRLWRLFLRPSSGNVSLDPWLTCHSKSSISQSLTRLKGPQAKAAVKFFQRILAYMGDDNNPRSAITSEEACATAIRAFVKDVDEYGPDMVTEILCQLAKQTADNPSVASLRRGWELLVACALSLRSTSSSAELAGALCHHAAQYRRRADAVGGLSLSFHDYVLRGLQRHRNSDYDVPHVPPASLNRDKHILPLKTYTAPDQVCLLYLYIYIYFTRYLG